MSLPREWSPKDHYFYKQCIHQAWDIDYIPSSIATIIAETVRDTSVLKSDWKKVARSLGLNKERILKQIEDAAGWKQELPLYIAMTAPYWINPAASFGRLLDSLMKLKRYDILIKIKDDVQDAIHEHNGLKTSRSLSSQQKLKNEPVEESAECLGRQNMAQEKTVKYNQSKTASRPSGNYSYSNYSHKHSESESNYDSAFCDQHSPPNSFIKILSKNDEITKTDYSIDCCHSSYERDKSAWTDTYKEENLVGNKMLSVKKDPGGTIDFQFIDPTVKNKCLTTHISGIELNSQNSNALHDEVNDSSLSSVYVSCSTEENKEPNSNMSEEYYDSDTTYDDDFDINSVEQMFGATNSCNQDTELFTQQIDDDNRKKENERCQFLGISDQRSETDFDTHDIQVDNSVNERIADLVAVKDENLRDVERAERKPISVLFSVQKTVKKPHDHLLRLVSDVLPSDRSINILRSIKVIVVHSQQDSNTAIDIATALVKEFNMAAVAECQLGPVWLMDPSLYRTTALHWADVIIPLITNTWLEDINNEVPLMEREVPSLNARSVFKILQNMFLNRGSVNFSSVPVVMEGTSRRFINYPEIRDAIKLSKNFSTDGSIKTLGELIKGFHHITKDAKKAFLEQM